MLKVYRQLEFLREADVVNEVNDELSEFQRTAVRVRILKIRYLRIVIIIDAFEREGMLLPWHVDAEARVQCVVVLLCLRENILHSHVVTVVVVSCVTASHCCPNLQTAVERFLPVQPCRCGNVVAVCPVGCRARINLVRESFDKIVTFRIMAFAEEGCCLKHVLLADVMQKREFPAYLVTVCL